VSEPDAPDAATREHLLGVLAELVARGGSAALLLAPVVPGDAAFPDRWAPTKAGVALLLRRLAWHAGLERDIDIEDRRAGAPQTERKPATSVEVIEVRDKTALFVLRYIGEDDVAGTLAHEIGIAYAALHRPGEVDPFRKPVAPVLSIDPDVDLERGSIAAVYLGLGVLAANAARQHHSVLEGQSYNPLFVARVGVTVEAGDVPASSLAYLLAVQACVRGEHEPPAGLAAEQRREVAAWLAVLEGSAGALRERLGIASDARPGTRPEVVAFDVGQLEDDPPVRANAFRWQTHRGGVGLVAGTVLGVGFAVVLATRAAAPLAIAVGAVCGHVAGRRVRVVRCSSCATICAADATTCPKCGAALRGDIARLADRLDAEEHLLESSRESTDL
jgi:hypothetical protein